MSMQVEPFFDPTTFTYSYVVSDPLTRQCAVIDSVLDYDAASGHTHTEGVERLLHYMRDQQLELRWILETHIHADHLSAADYIREEMGGRLGIGAQVHQVQQRFREIFNCEEAFIPDGHQFDHLFEDGERFIIGGLSARVIHTPGHTPGCVSYLIEDAVFVGDTLFMPDYGSARCDFPGGDARALYRSIQSLYALPDETRVFLCHDYKAEGRDEFQCETSIGEQRRHNVHAHEGIDEEQFVRARTERDASLSMPNLILPAVQVNMRAGRLPEPESNGVRYLKIPLNLL